MRGARINIARGAGVRTRAEACIGNRMVTNAKPVGKNKIVMELEDQDQLQPSGKLEITVKFTPN